MQTGLLQHLTLHAALRRLIRFDAATRQEPIAAPTGVFNLLDEQDMMIADNRSLITGHVIHTTSTLQLCNQCGHCGAAYRDGHMTPSVSRSAKRHRPVGCTLCWAALTFSFT